MAPKNQKKSKNKVSLTNRWLAMNDDELCEAIANDAKPCYPESQPSKPLQIKAVANLVKQRNTFVMAGTGFGKSRIPEMYLHLFAPSKRAVVIVLNPLDALGDNQVTEKISQGFTAVNLKKLNFSPTVAADVRKGKYNFVYLSPEVFLNNKKFTEVFYDESFQDRLALIVVDEAHMVYSWGLVESGKSKKSSAHKRHLDRVIFRPSYGKLGAQLMATQNIPVLLLSATCRPLAITEIQKSLKLMAENIHFVRAELTRPEIRILRFPMEFSLKSAKNLLAMFGHENDHHDKDILPTLIYSGTRNSTIQVMRVVNQARGTSGGEYNPQSSVIRRYHSVTGDLAKAEVVQGFEANEFSCISCTMALGLGQNWKKVRRVIHMGRGDPSCICQMVGHCGRDGKNGLAILFVEPKRKFGLNTVEAIAEANRQTDDVHEGKSS